MKKLKLKRSKPKAGPLPKESLRNILISILITLQHIEEALLPGEPVDEEDAPVKNHYSRKGKRNYESYGEEDYGDEYE